MRRLLLPLLKEKRMSSEKTETVVTQLSHDEERALTRLGLAAPQNFWLELVQQFGPLVAAALLKWLTSKGEKAGGLLDNISLAALRHILGNLLSIYRQQIEDSADATVKQALDTLQAWLDK